MANWRTIDLLRQAGADLGQGLATAGQAFLRNKQADIESKKLALDERQIKVQERKIQLEEDEAARPADDFEVLFKDNPAFTSEDPKIQQQMDQEKAAIRQGLIAKDPSIRSTAYKTLIDKVFAGRQQKLGDVEKKYRDDYFRLTDLASEARRNGKVKEAQLYEKDANQHLEAIGKLKSYGLKVQNPTRTSLLHNYYMKLDQAKTEGRPTLTPGEAIEFRELRKQDSLIESMTKAVMGQAPGVMGDAVRARKADQVDRDIDAATIGGGTVVPGKPTKKGKKPQSAIPSVPAETQQSILDDLDALEQEQGNEIL